MHQDSLATIPQQQEAQHPHPLHHANSPSNLQQHSPQNAQQKHQHSPHLLDHPTPPASLPQAQPQPQPQPQQQQPPPQQQQHSPQSSQQNRPYSTSSSSCCSTDAMDNHLPSPLSVYSLPHGYHPYYHHYMPDSAPSNLNEVGGVIMYPNCSLNNEAHNAAASTSSNSNNVQHYESSYQPHLSHYNTNNNPTKHSYHHHHQEATPTSYTSVIVDSQQYSPSSVQDLIHYQHHYEAHHQFVH